MGNCGNNEKLPPRAGHRHQAICTCIYRIVYSGIINGNTYVNLGNWFQNRAKNDSDDRNTLLAPNQLHHQTENPAASGGVCRQAACARSHALAKHALARPSRSKSRSSFTRWVRLIRTCNHCGRPMLHNLFIFLIFINRYYKPKNIIWGRYQNQITTPFLHQSFVQFRGATRSVDCQQGATIEAVSAGQFRGATRPVD